MKAELTKPISNPSTSKRLVPFLFFVALALTIMLVCNLSNIGEKKALADNPDNLIGGNRYGDYLNWYNEQAANPDASDRRLLEQLGKCKVPTPKKAKSIAIGHKLAMRMDAQERISVNRLVRLAREVPGFAKKGDYVWVIRSGMHVSGDFGMRGVTDEFWISSTTGACLSILQATPMPMPRPATIDKNKQQAKPTEK